MRSALGTLRRGIGRDVCPANPTSSEAKGARGFVGTLWTGISLCQLLIALYVLYQAFSKQLWAIIQANPYHTIGVGLGALAILALSRLSTITQRLSDWLLYGLLTITLLIGSIASCWASIYYLVQKAPQLWAKILPDWATQNLTHVWEARTTTEKVLIAALSLGGLVGALLFLPKLGRIAGGTVLFMLLVGGTLLYGQQILTQARHDPVLTAGLGLLGLLILNGLIKALRKETASV